MIEDNDALYADSFMPSTRTLSESCIEGIGVDGVAIAILTDDAQARDLLYATDDVAARLDELQFTTGEGPCLDAFRDGNPRKISDLGDPAVAGLWPTFASEVVGELKVHAVFAYPILLGQANFGILELYRREAGPLTAMQHSTALAITAVAGRTISGELDEYSGPLNRSDFASPSGPHRPARADVHIATGILSVRLETSITDASAQLRARAYAESRSVSSLAYDIVHDNVAFGVE